MNNRPQQKDLFSKRWRKVPRYEPSELQIQTALVERLSYMRLPNVVYFHVPNGELRDDRTAAKLKAMGVLPGVADLIFIYVPWCDAEGLPRESFAGGPLRVLGLELKAPRRKPTDDQRYFGERLRRIGGAFEVADNVDQAVEILEKYAVIPLTTQGLI